MANFINNPLQQNYYFKKAVAYTEDHIVVKKLFLYNVAPKLKQEDVQKYFEGYGRVLRVQLFAEQALKINGNRKKAAHNNMRRLKTGYVHFFSPRDAAKALRKTMHKVNGCRLFVQANDSWHQPDAYGSESELSSETPEEPTGDILNLNDYCLEHIIRMLSLPDRIHFARTCTRLQSVYEQVSPALHRCISFDVFDGMTVWDMRDFFMLSGGHVRHIEGIIPPGRCQRLSEFFGMYCINLVTMRVTASKLTVRTMYKLFDRLNCLEELQLRACGLSNSSLLALKNQTKLKRLDLSDNHKLTGLNMNFLPTCIEYLSLTSCNGLQSKYLPKMCKALPNLRVLNLKAVYTISTGFQQMVSSKCCPSLEEITLSTGLIHEYEHVAKLPALKKLVLYSYQQGTTLRPQILSWLVEHKSMQLQHFETRGQNCIDADMLNQIGQLRALQYLSLPHNNAIGARELETIRLEHLEEINLKYWPNLTNNAVLRLILCCTKLHKLWLEECPELTEKLLHDIIFKVRLQLRNKENVRQLPIRMHVFGSKISEFSLKHVDIAAKDIIHACLTPPASSDLCLVRMANLMEFDFNTEEYDSFGSDDELDPDHDRYLLNQGFFSDEENNYEDLMFSDEELFGLNFGLGYNNWYDLLNGNLDNGNGNI